MSEELTTEQVEQPTAQPTEQATPQAEQPAEEEQHGLLTQADEPEQPAEQPTEQKQEATEAQPEEPNYEITLRDGFAMDEGLKTEVTTLFKESKLSQEQAQKFADFYMDKLTAQRQAQIDAYRDIQSKEIQATQSDPEIGGDVLKQNLGYAKEAMARFGGDAFIRELEAHGMANNVEMIRLLTKVYHATKSDTLVSGKQNASRDPAHIMYPEWK